MRFAKGDRDGLGCTATVDDEHAATASHAVSARQRRMFLFYYTGAAIWFPARVPPRLDRTRRIAMAISLDYLQVEDAPPAGIITLNRPDQLNAPSTGLQ